ncbi:MAG: hypothetical protein HOQ05_00240 [Corynebacteriales bacterium]|nr:hypothetical protein [Mycobacteriales bacterium]
MARWLVRIVTLMACVGMFLGLAAGSVGGAKPAFAQEEEPPEAIADHVIVLGVPGLRWEDVNGRDTPNLARMVRQGSAGSLSVRSAPSVTCPAEGWLTVGAGTYGAVIDPAEIEADQGCEPRLPPPVPAQGPQVPTMAELIETNGDLRFGAHPGLLGDRLACTTAVGPGAALAAANPEGTVSYYSERLEADAANVLSLCPFTAVEAPAVSGEGAERRKQVQAADELLRRVLKAKPDNSIVMVLGVSETEATQPRLHVAVVQGPTFGPGWLRSPSTRRVPYVQLSDIAPTVLAALGNEVPENLAGRPLIGEEPGRPRSFNHIVDELTDTDTQAVAQRSVVGIFFVGFAVVLVLVIGAMVFLLYRQQKGKKVPPLLSKWLSIVCLGLAAVPTATFLANLVPWWRSEWPALTIWGVVAAVSATMLALALSIGALFPRWERRIGVRISVLAAITLGVFVVDGVTGTWLQLNSMLGYNPLVAGRFVGFGNIAFAVYAVAAVLLATFMSYGYKRNTSIVILTAIAVPVIIFDGFPQWGADFGGVITLVPTFVVLGLLITKAKISWLRVSLSIIAGFALVMLIGWLDYLRPSSSRSHFGRFVASVLDGSAMATIYRKLMTSLELLFMGPHTIAAMLGVLLGAYLVLRPRPSLRVAYETWPVVRVAMIATLVLAGFAFATNDSGVAIPSVMSLVVLPLVMALCTWAAIGDPWHKAPVKLEPEPQHEQAKVR